MGEGFHSPPSGRAQEGTPYHLKGDLVLCSTGSVLCLPSISSGMERNSPKARRLHKASGQSFFSQSCWSHQFPPQLAGAWTQETSEGSPLITGVELHHRPHGTSLHKRSRGGVGDVPSSRYLQFLSLQDSTSSQLLCPLPDSKA